MAAFFKVGRRDHKLIFRDVEFPLHLARPMRSRPNSRFAETSCANAPIIGNVLSHLETLSRVMPRSEVQR
ncbi:hypothetical protein CHY08_26595 (plasmid) [Rhizobium leguminosarum bv. viciae]|nr:hypothetical protein CHY08_26595 [Rhizobium leguminosarum bv. viciae]